MMNTAISGMPVDSCPKHRKIRVVEERTVKRERERNAKPRTVQATGTVNQKGGIGFVDISSPFPFEGPAKQHIHLKHSTQQTHIKIKIKIICLSAFKTRRESPSLSVLKADFYYSFL